MSKEYSKTKRRGGEDFSCEMNKRNEYVRADTVWEADSLCAAGEV
jgi:hypothetical protein